MAMCVIPVVGDAPCQCFSPGGNQTTSPGVTSCIGPPSCCTRPTPAVMTMCWPSGWVCHAVRAPGANVTVAPATRDGSLALNSGSIRTEPVNQSAGPGCVGIDPTFAISMRFSIGASALATCFERGAMRIVDEAPTVDKSTLFAIDRAGLYNSFALRHHIVIW